MPGIETVSAGDLESRVLKASGAVVLDFYQASCPPCRVLAPRLERIAGEYEQHVRTYRVDVDRDLEVARRFKVMSLPTVLVLRNGQEVERLDGLINDDDLRGAFERASRP